MLSIGLTRYYLTNGEERQGLKTGPHGCTKEWTKRPWRDCGATQNAVVHSAMSRSSPDLRLCPNVSSVPDELADP
jgi:hypothetical protein